MITIDIGELVLHGFPTTDRYAIAEAAAAELARLVSGQPARRLDPRPGSLAEQVAAAVYEAVRDA